LVGDSYRYLVSEDATRVGLLSHGNPPRNPWTGQCTTGAGTCRATERTSNGHRPRRRRHRVHPRSPTWPL